jgi:DNA-binding transcriptional MerR regulator
MKHGERLWTLDELAAEVASALAEGYAGAASGRVRDVPDRRTIRYYTTLGLMDRPSEMRGRTALYGRRHLLQIVAIKKLQARGRSLAEIQRELTGQTDAYLAGLAAQDVRPVPERSDRNDAPDRGRDFWRREPEAHAGRALGADDDNPERETADLVPPDGGPRPLVGLTLVEGVTLLLAPSRRVDAEDLAAMRLAAAPLLDTLTRSRLIDPREQGEVP